MGFRQMTGKRILLFAALLMGAWGTSRAQMPPGNTDFWSRVRYGGGIGLSFGKDAFQIGLSPSAVYQVNPYTALGLGLNYTHSKIFDTRLTAFGGSVIGLVNPVPALQLSAEFEALRIRRSFGPIEDSYWLPALFLGVGYNTGPVTFGMRFDVLYDSDKSLYADPWLPFVRVYF